MSKPFGGLYEWWGWWKEKRGRNSALGKLLPSGLFCLLEGGGGGGSWEKKRSWESCTVNCYPSGPSWLQRISHFVSLDNIFFGHTVNPLLTKVSLLSQDDWILVKILYFNGGLIKQKVLKPKLEFQEGSS